MHQHHCIICTHACACVGGASNVCCAGNDARYNKQKQNFTTLLNVV